MFLGITSYEYPCWRALNTNLLGSIKCEISRKTDTHFCTKPKFGSRSRDYLVGLLSTFSDRILEITLKLSSHVAQLGGRTQNHQKWTRASNCRVIGRQFSNRIGSIQESLNPNSDRFQVCRLKARLNPLRRTLCLKSLSFRANIALG